METCTMSMTEIGAKLRDVRKQQNMSTNDVQVKLQDEFKAAVLKAYERGERNISLKRLKAIADFYQVPISWFLTKG